MTSNFSTRNESISSHVLRISKWLREAQEDAAVSFLKTWQLEATNTKSLGEFVSTILIQTHSLLLTPNVTSALLQHCRKFPNNVKKTNHDHNDNDNHNANGVTTYPCTKNTIASGGDNYFPLLSLPFDIFNELGWYLSKEEGINLGYCSHGLYNATQNIQFLKSSGYHYLELNGELIQKIMDFRIDPWSWCVGCYGLMLTGHKSNPDTDKIAQNIGKLMQISQNTTQWFDVLFHSIQELEILKRGTVILESIPIESLFSLNSNINSPGRGSGSGVQIERTSLKLSVDNILCLSDTFYVRKFARRYNDYYVNDCDSDISKVRSIDSITIHSTRSHMNINENIADHNDRPVEAFDMIKYFQPNYPHLKVDKDAKLKITGLNRFCNIFHKNLTHLSISRVDIWTKEILFDCLQQAALDGKYLRINDALIDEFVDDENGDDNNGKKISEYKALFTRHETRIEDINRDISESQLTKTNKLHEMYEWQGNEIQALEFGDEVISEEVKVTVICLYILHTWLVKFIDAKMTDIIANGHNINRDRIAPGHTIEHKNNINGDHSESDQDHTDEKKDQLGSIIAGKHTANIQTLTLNDRSYKSSRFYNFAKTINDVVNNKVGYRLLNWKKTVEVLYISFAPCIRVNDEYHIDKWKKEFKLAMKNIFKHFDNLRKLRIEFKFHSDMIDTNINPETESQDENKINETDNNTEKTVKKQTGFDMINTWIEIFCQEFEANIDKMIEKYHNTKHSVFKMSFYLIVGDFANDDYIDMVEFLHYKNKLNCFSDYEFKLRHKITAKLYVPANGSGESGQVEKHKKYFCKKYRNQLMKIQQMISSLAQCGDWKTQSFQVWKGMAIKNVKDKQNSKNITLDDNV